ncbi:MAG: hypothetical protein ACKO1U_02615, partial [Bacteroidota bacterium]
LNKVGWDPRTKPPRVATGVKMDGSGFFGPRCDTGSYTIRLTRAGKSVETNVRLMEDPTSPHSAADRALQRKTVAELFRATEDLAFLCDRVYSSSFRAKQLADSTNGSLKKSLLAYSVQMDTIRKELVATKPGLAITGEEKIREKLSELYGGVMSYQGRPSDAQLDKMRLLLSELNDQNKKSQEIWDKSLPGINANLSKAGMTVITIKSRNQFDQESDAAGATGVKGYSKILLPIF